MGEIAWHATRVWPHGRNSQVELQILCPRRNS